MPYKDPERQLQWEQAHRKQRTERRKSQRRASRQSTGSSFVRSPSAEARAIPTSGAAARARQLGRGKAHGLASAKKTGTVPGSANRPPANGENGSSGWVVLLGLTAAILLPVFFGFWGLPGGET
jgi:hypothetical protein